MARRGSKTTFMLIVLALLILSLIMCQEIAATSRLRSKESTCISTGIACHVRATVMENDESPPQDDYGYDYDFYRKHGDIPSPGAGH